MESEVAGLGKGQPEEPARDSGRGHGGWVIPHGGHVPEPEYGEEQEGLTLTTR